MTPGKERAGPDSAMRAATTTVRTALPVALAVLLAGRFGDARPRSAPCLVPRCGAAATTGDHVADSGVHVIHLQTYDGSGQAMHPDVVETPATWGADRMHLVVTPYPNGDVNQENPSVYASPDGIGWSVVAGVRNPIARAAPGAGHLSDPAAVFVPEAQELWVYYRQVADSNRIWLIRSRDGVQWSAPVRVVVAPNNHVLSPSVVHRAPGQWEMWSVDGGPGCGGAEAFVERRSSTDGKVWGAPERVSLTVPWDGYVPWHIAVTWIPAESRYWALFNAKRAGDCATPALFVAVSRDGLTWITFPQPLLQRGAIPEFRDVVYRASMTYEGRADAVRFWFSGARRHERVYVWALATQHLDRLSVRNRLTAGPLLVPLMSRTAPTWDTVRTGDDP